MDGGGIVRVAVEPGSLRWQTFTSEGPRWLRRGAVGALSVARELWLPYLLASILILYGFQWGLPDPPYLTSSFQPDEGAAVWAVSQINFPRFDPQILQWGTGLFYQVYVVKEVLTASHLIHASDFWIYVLGRLVVYVSALGAITATFFTAQKLFDHRTGWLAALFLSVLPGFVITSHYFKPDVPMTFWAVVTLLATFWMLEVPTIRQVAILGLLVGYSASVKYNAVVLAPVAAIAIVLAFRRSGRPLPVVPFVAAVTAGFAVGDPYAFLDFPNLVYWLKYLAGIEALSKAYAATRPPAWLDYPINVFPYAMTTPFLLLSAAGLLYGVVRRSCHVWVSLLFSLTYYLLLCVDSQRLVRYTVPLLPIGAILSAHLIRDLSRTQIGRLACVPGVAAIVGFLFVFSLSYTQTFAQPDPRVQGSMWIQAHLPKETPIAVSTTNNWNVPQLGLIGYRSVAVGVSIAKLQAVNGPYLILSDVPKLWYEEAIDHYPAPMAFYGYVDSHYCEVTHFLNSQELLGINSRRGSLLPGDWIDPNPQITILKRATNGCPARS